MAENATSKVGDSLASVDWEESAEIEWLVCDCESVYCAPREVYSALYTGVSDTIAR